MEWLHQVNHDLWIERGDLQAKCLLLEQINYEISSKENEVWLDYEQRIQDLTNKLEWKEYMIQQKEAKWFEVEKLMVEYARDDLELWKKLCEVKYLCDDSSTGWGINNVIVENKHLTNKLKNAFAVIDGLNMEVQNLHNAMRNQRS